MHSAAQGLFLIASPRLGPQVHLCALSCRSCDWLTPAALRKHVASSLRGRSGAPGGRVQFTLSGGELSAGQEPGGDRSKLLVELEDPAVAGVGVDDQLTALDAAMQVLGED